MNEIQELSVPEQAKSAREERRANQEGKLPKLKLMLATPMYMQQCFAHYTESLLNTAKMLDAIGVEWTHQFLNGDSYIQRAKTTILNNFLESDCTHILMIDSDMSFSPEAVGRMLRHTQSIVGGFFPMKNAFNTFAGFLSPDGDGRIPDVGSAIELWDGSCLLKAHLVPGGFLCIHRDVLEKFCDFYPDLVYKDPCADPSRPERIYSAFFECMIHEHLFYGEDATFCRRMRDMGESLWCDPNISFGHTGMKTYTGNYHQYLLKPIEELEAIAKDREELANSVTAVRVESVESEDKCAY